METIRNYLENMFAALPCSDEVLKAKEELSQMMEDKYNELIEEGKSENEAVGIVISEFGNLEEIAEELGLDTNIKSSDKIIAEKNLIKIDKIKAKNYLKDVKKFALLNSLGIFFIFLAFVPTVVLSEINISGVPMEEIGVAGMFFILFIGVVLICTSRSFIKKWSFIKNKLGILDYEGSKYILEEQERENSTNSLITIAGVFFIVLFFVTEIIIDGASDFIPYFVIDIVEGTIFFIFIGIIVLL